MCIMITLFYVASKFIDGKEQRPFWYEQEVSYRKRLSSVRDPPECTAYKPLDQIYSVGLFLVSTCDIGQKPE